MLRGYVQLRIDVGKRSGKGGGVVVWRELVVGGVVSRREACD